VLYPTALIASKEKLLGKNIPLKTDISVVGYSAKSESALIRFLNFKNDGKDLKI
jgi:hypothetical protein